MLLACCTSRAKEWERTETADLKRIKLAYHTSVTENPFTKSDLMKSILSDSAVLRRKPLHRLRSRDGTGSSTGYWSRELKPGSTKG